MLYYSFRSFLRSHHRPPRGHRSACSCKVINLLCAKYELLCLIVCKLQIGKLWLVILVYILLISDQVATRLSQYQFRRLLILPVYDWNLQSRRIKYWLSGFNEERNYLDKTPKPTDVLGICKVKSGRYGWWFDSINDSVININRSISINPNPRRQRHCDLCMFYIFCSLVRVFANEDIMM